MFKRYVFALGILFGSAMVVSAQQPGGAEEGLVILKEYDPAVTAAIVTDARGRFVFTRYGLEGRPSRNLWKLEEAAKTWAPIERTAVSGSGDLLLIAGKTDLKDVPPGSMVQAVYWKDASGTAWCLTNSGKEPLSPTLVQIAISGNPPVLDLNRQSDGKGWLGKFPIRVQFK